MHQNHLEILFKKKKQKHTHTKKQIAGLQSETTGMGQIQEFSFLTFFPNDTDTCWSGTHTLRTTGRGNQENLKRTSKYIFFFFFFLNFGGVGQM